MAKAGVRRSDLFHEMKQSVSPLETNCFMAWNEVFHFDKIVHGYGCCGSRIRLRWLTDAAVLAHGYYCVGSRILLRRVTDITASASADVSVGLLRRLNQLTETSEFANRTT